MSGCVVATVGASAVALILVLRWMLQKKVSVKNKVVLVTGASSGLGEACAHAFYKAGAKVIISARREGELIRVKQEMLSSTVSTQSYEPKILVMDLADLKSIPRLSAESIQLFGNVDILVNNGGISYRGEALTTSIDVDQNVMLVNYFGQVALTKALLPHMIEQKSGHIIGVSSIQGRIAIPHRSAYAASKHAFQAFLDSLRAEISDTGVKVSVFSPAYIKTSLSLNAVTEKGQKYGAMDKTTASGMTPEYVANRILHLVQHQEDDVVLAPSLFKMVIGIRTLFPSLYFWIMNRRAKKKQG